MKKVYYKYVCKNFPDFLDTILYKKEFKHISPNHKEIYVIVKEAPSLLVSQPFDSVERWKNPEQGIRIVNNQLIQVCSVCYSEDCPGFIERNVL